MLLRRQPSTPARFAPPNGRCPAAATEADCPTTPKRDDKRGAEHAEPAKKDEPLEKAVGRRSRIVLRVHHAVLLALVEAALVWHLALQLRVALRLDVL